jgi:recombination protein RecR
MERFHNSSGLPPTVLELIDVLSKFPGIGRKSAQRMAMYVLRSSPEFARNIADSINAVKEKVAFCRTCWMLSEEDPCPICKDAGRTRQTVCVVEESGDVIAIEKTGTWRGLYHVLGGAIAPLDGIGPEDLHLEDLFDRIDNGEIIEVVVATNPTSEGETTALYIARRLRNHDVTVSRIARGIPMGADLELVDESTLQQSLEGRVEISENGV